MRILQIVCNINDKLYFNQSSYVKNYQLFINTCFYNHIASSHFFVIASLNYLNINQCVFKIVYYTIFLTRGLYYINVSLKHFIIFDSFDFNTHII